MHLPVIAGMVSTVLFIGSTLPMLWKAMRTRDLRSYSLGQILLANGGNLIYALYVFSLPPGPIWLLHAFNLATTALMLVWYTRYEWRPAPERFLGRWRQDFGARRVPGRSGVRRRLQPPADLGRSPGACTTCGAGD